MPKYIREARAGAPKTYKTGAVLGNTKNNKKSYPQPILYVGFDAGGHEICPDIKTENILTAEAFLKDRIGLPMDQQPNITVIELHARHTVELTSNYVPPKDSKRFEDTIRLFNGLRKSCPFKTIIVDPVTELSNAILSHVSQTNESLLADARKWAPVAGNKVQQIIEFCTSLPANSVFIFHTEVIKDEITNRVDENLVVYSSLRHYITGKFNQVFYQTVYGGKTILRVKPFENVRGIGTRWPLFSTETVEPFFEDIYGKEPDVYR